MGGAAYDSPVLLRPSPGRPHRVTTLDLGQNRVKSPAGWASLKGSSSDRRQTMSGTAEVHPEATLIPSKLELLAA